MMEENPLSLSCQEHGLHSQTEQCVQPVRLQPENTQLEGGHKEYSLTQTKGGEGRGQGYCFVEYCVGWS